MTERNRLPNRRPHELLDFSFRGQFYTLGIGRDVTGAPVEVFIDAAASGIAGAVLDILAGDRS
jgi:hypothetical protein